MKGTTVVLVVLNTYVHYGEDLEPIDELERKIKQTFKGFENVEVSFLITNENDVLGSARNIDAVAFYYPRYESLYYVYSRGIPVLNYNDRTGEFEFVSVVRNGFKYEVMPISLFGVLENFANTNK